MKAAIATKWNELEPLLATWDALEPGPYGSAAMARAWLRENAATVRPFAVAVHDSADRLLAIAPWAIVRRAPKLNVLTGIGGSDAAEHDPVVAPDTSREAIAAAIATALARHRFHWDVVQLNLRARDGDPLLAQFRRLGWLRYEREEWRTRPIADIGDDWDAFCSARSPEYLGNVRRRMHRLAKEPHRFIRADHGNVEALLDTLFELHRARWTHREWQPLHTSLRDVARDALDQGRLHLHALEIRDALAALLLALRRGDRGYLLMQVFDPELTKFSAGTLVMHRCLEAMAHEGVKKVDLGPGSSEWKRRLQTGEIEMVQPVLARLDSPLGLARVAWTGWLKPWFKQNPEAVGWLRKLAPADAGQQAVLAK